MTCLLVLLLSVQLSLVEGRVINSDVPLPGCTVRLEAGELKRTAVTDAEGNYRFEGVLRGEYELTFELEGFRTQQERIAVRDETVAVPVRELPISQTIETITLNCHSSCNDQPPETPYTRPRCSDYELDSALIESLEGGDGSALALLETRYAQADSYEEQHRLAGVLLRKSKNDAQIWNELLARAEIAVRFPAVEGKLSTEYLQWSAEQQVDPDAYRWMSLNALGAASEDSRSKPLLLRALATADELLLSYAIGGLAMQRDIASLPLIEKAIARVEPRNPHVMALAMFHDERADAIARKYFENESDVERYRQYREASEQDSRTEP